MRRPLNGWREHWIPSISSWMQDGGVVTAATTCSITPSSSSSSNKLFSQMHYADVMPQPHSVLSVNVLTKVSLPAHTSSDSLPSHTELAEAADMPCLCCDTHGNRQCYCQSATGYKCSLDATMTGPCTYRSNGAHSSGPNSHVRARCHCVDEGHQIYNILAHNGGLEPNSKRTPATCLTQGQPTPEGTQAPKNKRLPAQQYTNLSSEHRWPTAARLEGTARRFAADREAVARRSVSARRCRPARPPARACMAAR